ncbi:MAG: DUF996 domain-containing protein [Nitrososphaerota archaeon]|jgi:uncharacterized membrane protein|nr:DUF996 domain-containing protein [Nitrososphaerota archaeon]
MSLEVAKKYGFTASLINVILPIASIAVIGIVFFQLISQILNNAINNNTASYTFVPVAIGLGIVIGVMGLIGLILFLLSMHKLSKYYKEPQIFRYILYTLIIQITCSITITVLFTFTLMVNNSYLNSMPNVFVQPISILIVASAVSIINGVLYWQAFTKLGEKSDIHTFKTAGLLYLIGSVTSIIGIGAILIWISWIFATQAYKQLKPQQQPTTIYTTQPTTNNNLNNNDIIYCSQCGTENNTNNINCTHCGTTLQTT